MSNETDSEFLNELAASFSADGSFDVEDRLRSIAKRLDELEAPERGWKLYQSGSPNNG